MTDSSVEIKLFDANAEEYEHVKHLFRKIWGAECQYLDNHVTYVGWRGSAATIDGNVIGFIWGYRSTSGQWFHDLAEKSLDPETYDKWFIESFELAEFGIHPDHQGRGIGTRLHDALFSEISATRAVTVTDIDNIQARRFYQIRGWKIVRERVTFTGSDKALLGLELR